ncbi:MAG: formylglycine-generating enzyme family protein [Deltaproteobacteria bacterium]|nr:formylglycine-generating enzyme family protein [Deltaproteobacteria bacterium]
MDFSKIRILVVLGVLFFSGLFFLSTSELAQGEKNNQKFTNSLNQTFVKIPAQTFIMGALEGDNDSESDESPAHSVTISRDFYLGTYPVTQEEFFTVMGYNPSHFVAPKQPVENLSYPEVMDFIERLNLREGTKKYRLPTEAEWEVAARGGSQGTYHFGNDPAQLSQYAWFAENSNLTTQPVGLKRPNPYGLYDMYGNVFEWLADYYDRFFYEYSPIIDPLGPKVGNLRSVRGCSYKEKAFFCRSSDRAGLADNVRISTQGFRLAISESSQPSN